MCLGYLSYDMDQGDMSRGKKEIWDKDDKLDGLRTQTIAELRRMEEGTCEHVIRKTWLPAYGIVVVSCMGL